MANSNLIGSAAAPATSAKPAAKRREVLERDADKITSELVARDQAMAAEVVARDETLAPKMKTTVTTMFVRGGAIPAGMFVLLPLIFTYEY